MMARILFLFIFIEISYLHANLQIKIKVVAIEKHISEFTLNSLLEALNCVAGEDNPSHGQNIECSLMGIVVKIGHFCK